MQLAIMSKGEASNSVSGEDIAIEIKKTGNNSRSLECKVAVNASFDIIWNLMTDYEKFADFMPGITDCKLIDKKDNTTRLCQITEVKLPFGASIKVRFVMDYFEKNIETFASGKKGDIEFKLAEGDLQIFEGKWIIEQVNKSRPKGSGTSVGEGFEVTLSYIADLKPRPWLPIRLVEGRLLKDLQVNLSSVREKAEKMMHAAQQPLGNNTQNT